MIDRREEGMFDNVTRPTFHHQFHCPSTGGPRRGVVNRDDAQYHPSRMHKAERWVVAPRFNLSFLPSATPQLNPIERVPRTPPDLHNHVVGT